MPILLAAFALGRHVADAQRIYETVFVVVLASVIVQGGTIGIAARRLGVERAPESLGDAANRAGEPGCPNALVGIDDAHRAGLVDDRLTDHADGLIAPFASATCGSARPRAGCGGRPGTSPSARPR